MSINKPPQLLTPYLQITLELADEDAPVFNEDGINLNELAGPLGPRVTEDPAFNNAKAKAEERSTSGRVSLTDEDTDLSFEGDTPSVTLRQEYTLTNLNEGG